MMLQQMNSIEITATSYGFYGYTVITTELESRVWDRIGIAKKRQERTEK